MKASTKYLQPRDIKRIADKHRREPFCPRDAALIALSGMACFNATELSLLRVADVIDERRGLVEDGYLPESFSASGKSRYFVFGKGTYINEILEDYMAWRKNCQFGLLDRELFSGFDPQSYFFLKDDGTPFTLNFKNRHEGDTATQPLQLQRLFKTFYLGEGVNIRTLNDSFIQNFWRAKSDQGTAQAIRDLMELTGLTAETLRVKCIREPLSIQAVLGKLYK